MVYSIYQHHYFGKLLLLNLLLIESHHIVRGQVYFPCDWRVKVDFYIYIIADWGTKIWKK